MSDTMAVELDLLAPHGAIRFLSTNGSGLDHVGTLVAHGLAN